MRTAALALALAGSAFAQDNAWPVNPWTLPANSLAALKHTVTSKVKSTVTVCPCVESTSSIASAPHYTITGGYGHGVSSSPAGPAMTPSESESTKTVEITVYTTLYPVTETKVSSGTTYTKTYSTASTITSSWSKPATYSASSGSEIESTKTIEITKYTTICPVTETKVSSGTTYTKTYSTISTVTSSVTKPVSYSASSSESASMTSPVSYSASSSGSASLTTLTSYTTFTSLCTTERGGSTTVETHTHSQPVYKTKTISASTTDTCTDSTSGYYPVPSGSGSLSSYGASGTGTAYSSGTAISYSSGTAVPYSSGTAVPYSSGTAAPYSSGTAAPYSSGTAAPYSSGSAIPYSSGTSSTKSKTTSAVGPSGTAECVRCSGNPGDDAFCGYTIHDNYYEVVPNTCRTVEYDFTITESTVAPDGISRPALIVNNQMPGPKIEASWGDYIQVTVHNKMPLNGSSIHFHGMRQNYTNEMDGVPSITQCPLAPGESQTYKFRATSYGTSWYHSHFALQTYEGVFGPMVIHGPIDEEMKYDAEELFLLQDWSHATADELFWPSEVVKAGSRGGAPTLDTGLINGLNVWGADGSSGQSGSRFEMTVTQGQTYRLRLINSAIASTFKFYIDGHKFKVIASDFVPIQPYETDIVNINIGQRYDILVTFDQPVGNYWLRSDNQASCNTIVQQGNIKGIVRYAGAPSTLPTSTAYTYTDACVDEPIASLVPIVALDAGTVTKTVDETVTIGANGGSPNLFKWSLSGTTFQSQWGAPTLQQIYENGTAPTYSGSLAIDVPTLGEWVYVIIDTPIPVTHPIHLHGHDFMILAQGTGIYTDQPLNTKNPARRDVVNMPAGQGVGGYVVIAWQADNPGAWLLHCHIGWHVAMGFALQIIENLEGIKDTITAPDMLTDTCASWNKYGNANAIFAAPWESGV